MKKLNLIGTVVLISLRLVSPGAQEAVEHSPANSKCFKCHGTPVYSYYNENIDRQVTKRMNPYFLIDSVEYYNQNHKSFECTDCHAYEYNTFPHDNELQMEPMLVCLDCHEGDDATADFNFEKIDQEYQESVHSTKHSEEFTCWMCHSPHSYKINARTNENIKETIVYDNNICLSCHADVNKYQLITPGKKNPNVIESHDWLPNQIVHFAHVRCIECHTDTSDKVLVAHKIQPKEKAVRKCVECHSQNSRLMASLYKYHAKESRNNLGFVNSSILSDAYVIGANRNYYLNIISGVIAGLVVLAIIIHAILRAITK